MPPQSNPTPKSRFLANSTYINQHRDLITSDAFIRATDVGLNHYQVLLANQVTDGNTAMAAGFKLQGALEYVQTMRLLSEIPKAPTLAKPETLDHTV